LLNTPNLTIVELDFNSMRMNRGGGQHFLNMATGKLTGAFMFGKLDHYCNPGSYIFSARSFHFSKYWFLFLELKMYLKRVTIIKII
jgi:hypothetical protein